MSKNLGIRTALRASGVTQGRLAEIYHMVLAEYDALAPALPDAMAWKTQKPAHARECGQEAREFAPILGFNDLEAAYFAIPFAAHDLGRMIEGLRKCIVPNAPKALRVTLPAGFRERWPLIDKPSRMHGDDSAELLRPLLGSFADTEIGCWTLLAVQRHSDVHNPTLEQVGGVAEALALCNVLRDLDKVEGFRQAKDYTSNPERKAKERLQNWPEQVKDDPAWGTELGRIDPDDALDAFIDGKAVDRSKSRSYERYMLQYLGWAKSIVDEDMLQLALHEGGPQTVAAYLLRQLKDVPEQRRRLFQDLETWKGGVLLRKP